MNFYNLSNKKLPVINYFANYFTVDQLNHYWKNCFIPDSDKVMKLRDKRSVYKYDEFQQKTNELT